MPPLRAAATAAPVAVARVEATASVASTVTAAAATPEVASAYREAGATLADPEQTDATKLAVVATLANDSSDVATDLLLVSTRNASIQRRRSHAGGHPPSSCPAGPPASRWKW
jgi:hypothetical protein